MSRATPVTQAQRNLITIHLSNPKQTTQADVIKRLRLKNSNNFYRLVYRVVRSN